MRWSLWEYARSRGKGKVRFPDKLSALYPRLVRELKEFARPGSAAPADRTRIDEEAGYVLVRGLSLDSPHDSVLLYEKAADRRGGVYVLFVDGHIEWISWSQLPRRLGHSATGEPLR